MPAWILLIIQLLPSLIKIIRELLGNMEPDQKKAFKRDLKDAVRNGDKTRVGERVQRVIERYS